jgi:hypothetical protein
MKKINVVLILAVFLFFACEEKGLNLTIRFDQIQGLQADDLVVFENNHVGQVTRVFYSNDGVYIVDLKIEEDFANAATEHSRFYIIEDPQVAEKKAVEMIQLHKGGTPLANGSSVVGSTQSSAMFQKMLEDFDEQTGKLGKQFRKFFEDLSKLPESEEVKQMEQAGKATRDKIQNDIVPMIKEELERLKKRLEKFGREEEVEPLEKQLEELTIT